MQDIKDRIDYLNKLADQIPAGLTHLNDVMAMVILDFAIYYRTGIKLHMYPKALAFADTIPKFTDFNSDECTRWMLHDREHLKYWK